MKRLEALRSLLSCLKGELPAGEDWVGIIGLANRSLCTPMLASRLKAAGRFSSLPIDVQQFLQLIQTRNEERNRRLLLQLDEAVALWNGVGVRPVLLKGTAWLADVAAGGRADRLITDLDMMVPADRFHEAIAQLVGAGYRPDTPIVRPEIPVVLMRPEDSGTIDLHTEYGGASILRLAHDDLAIDGTPCHLPRGVACLPSPVAGMAILLLHDQLKGRDYLRGRVDLRHLLDMQGLAAGFGATDWARLDGLFAAGYARAAARTQLLTAREMLDLPVPDGLIGVRARLQYWRRMVQICWPASALPLTILSLLDPQYLAARRQWREKASSASGNDAIRPGWLPRRESVTRLLSWTEVGKI
ncbi:nucleotidyltransferase family protein [Sphingobium sp. TCM1]|uniref:nucleotidyltransferase family protein n=1 Tax=Sphingobium sp. TCM1 TaxID=453246 RepID=UPI0007F33609|nr:nucleotidyltransferase family protein [Sphingobium sp. TCM1]OAN57758.1 hypothetical protein A7Q26_15320 [Sphingobium sp. TCM1]